jgi:hypothetical protein
MQNNLKFNIFFFGSIKIISIFALFNNKERDEAKKNFGRYTPTYLIFFLSLSKKICKGNKKNPYIQIYFTNKTI